ncbi:MAG: phage holin family protein [Minisyncoccia bacterium]
MGSLIKKLFFGVILNTVAVLVSEKCLNYLFQDFYFKGTITQLFLLAFILTILNLLIKPILHFIFLPLIWLTLGIFSLIINLIILKTASYLIPGVLVINSSLSWLGASLIVSFFNSFIHKA